MPVVRNINLSYLEYRNDEEMDPEDQELIDSARSAAINAYAPYSGFMVGAAVRLESGKIIRGSNVENAAFPSGSCAERTALSFAVTNYPDDAPVCIAIAATGSSGIPAENVSPCGNCRQFIAEEESRKGKKIRMILSGSGKTIIIESISDMLPLQFGKLNLGITPHQ
jgi:cytidine deaminase